MKKNKNILPNNIWLKISVFNSAGVFIRIITGWLVNKLIAIYIGPEGTTLSEQFRNLLQSASGISTLGIQEGTTKYIAQYQNNPKQFKSFLNTIYKIVWITSIVTGIIVAIFSSKLNQILFPGYDFSHLIFITGILLPIASLNIIINAILRGFQMYKKVTYINIVSNILMVSVAFFLISTYRLKGALYLVLATQIFSLMVTLYFIRKHIKSWVVFNFSKINKKHLKRLFNYIIMALLSTMIVPIFNILIRNLIFNYYAGDMGTHAGYWDAVKKISNLFLSLILPVFSLYYYPQLSKIHTNFELKKEIKKFLKQILPYFSIGIILLYIFKKWVIILFFSNKYLATQELFFWQLMGDYLKIISMTLAFLMLSKAHIKTYIFMEISFWTIYYFLSLFLLPLYNLKGVTIAYFLTYLLYLLGLVFFYGKYLFTKKEILIK